MRTILIPVDGSKHAEAAVQFAIRQAGLGQVGAIHLLNVQPPLGAYIGRFVGRRAVRDFQREQGERALAGAKRLLDEAGVAYSSHIYVGEIADTIARAARQLSVDEIVMGADGLGLLGSLGQSLVGRVIRRADVPVSVVKGAGADMDFEHSAGQWQLRPTP